MFGEGRKEGVYFRKAEGADHVYRGSGLTDCSIKPRPPINPEPHTLNQVWAGNQDTPSTFELQSKIPCRLITPPKCLLNRCGDLQR